MRVLFVTSSFARFAGDPLAAAGNSWYELARELGRHVEGTVLTPAQEDAPLLEPLGGLRVRRIPPARPKESLTRAAVGSGAARVWRLARAMRRGAAELAPSHDLVHALWAFPGGWATRNLDGPKVLTFPDAYIDLYDRVPGIKGAVGSVTRSFDTCVVLDPVGGEIAHRLGSERVEVVPTPVRLDGFGLAPPATGEELVFVGRLAKAKRVDVLLDAFARAVETLPSLRLRLVGDGPDRPELEARVRRLGIGERVVFEGTLSQREVHAALERARALVFSSDREGLPAAAVEALSTGRPVVATAVGGLPALLEGGAGIVVPKRDPDALAGAMTEALRRHWDPALLQAAARRSAVENVARRYLELYGELCDLPERRDVAEQGMAS